MDVDWSVLSGAESRTVLPTVEYLRSHLALNAEFENKKKKSIIGIGGLVYWWSTKFDQFGLSSTEKKTDYLFKLFLSLNQWWILHHLTGVWKFK